MDALKKEKDKHLGLRIDSELHFKLHYISQYEGRSANGEVIYLIRRAIEEFEKEHGKIEMHYAFTAKKPVAASLKPLANTAIAGNSATSKEKLAHLSVNEFSSV